MQLSVKTDRECSSSALMNNPILERVTELINAAPPAFLNRYLSGEHRMLQCRFES